MPVDYSKFAKIEDSDDEKKEAEGQEKARIRASASEAKPCFNCHEACQKQLKCGVCKTAIYCSPKCQKEDWRFHKRNCKAPKPKKKEGEKSPVREPIRPKASEVVRDDDDEVGDWYRHREWRPEAKQTFQPVKLDSSPEPEEAPIQSGASAWNVAGTWEDRAMTAWWKERLRALELTIDSACGVFALDTVESIEGDAQIVCVRGTARFLFDLKFVAKFTLRRGSDEGTVTLQVHDFDDATGLAIPMDVQVEGVPFKREATRVASSELVPRFRKALQGIVAEYGTK